LGDRSGEIRSPSSRAGIDQNTRNYRIRPDEAIGIGSLKEKFRQNLSAISTLLKIEAEDRQSTRAERSILVKYVGWGGLPQVFADEPPQNWQKEAAKLKELLNPDDWKSARASTLNSHYTSPEIIRAIYAGLERIGFKGGRILEPACGVGHFIGLMPDSMHGTSQITGIELDSVTARISKLLYPDADIRQGAFEKAMLPDNGFDLAVSNVPLATISLTTNDLMLTNIQFTTTSSPPPWNGYGQVVCWPLLRAEVRWISRVLAFAEI